MIRKFAECCNGTMSEWFDSYGASGRPQSGQQYDRSDGRPTGRSDNRTDDRSDGWSDAQPDGWSVSRPDAQSGRPADRQDDERSDGQSGSASRDGFASPQREQTQWEQPQREQPQWEPPQTPQWGAPQSATQQNRNAGSDMVAGFFARIRRSGITRSDDRWVGGVCGGLARYFGISPTLMRAIMVGAVLLAGFGAALYAFAWLLLPDDRNGTILGERLIAGDWDWSCLGVALCFIAGIVVPGAGLVATAAAAFALWLLLEREMRRRRGYGRVDSGPGGAQYRRGSAPQGSPQSAGSSFAGRAGSAGPQAAAGNDSGPNPQPYPWVGAQSYAQTSPQYQAQPQPSSQPLSQSPLQPSSQPSLQSPLQSPSQPFAQPFARPAAASPFAGPAAAANAVPSFSAPAPAAYQQSATQAIPMQMRVPQPFPARLDMKRRPPAGPLAVTVVIGLIFIFAAVALLQTPDWTITSLIRSATVWIGATCLLIGLAVLILGIRGRRAGGLIPVAWIAALTAVSILTANFSYNYIAMQYADLYGKYEVVDVSDSGTVNYLDLIKASANDNLTGDSPAYARLSDGVVFNGARFDRDRVLVDLSDYAKRPKHTAKLTNGSTVRTNCPTGTIHLAASNAQVVITLPTGCPFAFGADTDNEVSGMNVYGGRYSALAGNGEDYVGLHGTFSKNNSADVARADRYVDSAFSGVNANGADSPAWYRDYDYWPSDGSELLIDVRYLIGAQVFVRYPKVVTGDNGALFGANAVDGAVDSAVDSTVDSTER